jgi:hypothetical protein
MKVELEMYISEEDESVVMKNISEITKHAKELGFKLGEIEFKNDKPNKHSGEDKKNHHDD